MFNKEKWARIQELQKGTHIMSKIHKPLEDFIVYLLYDFDSISADHISIIVYILASFVVYFFIEQMVLCALIFAVIVGILDGVDGKIARLRQRPTKIGKIEHSFDMLYEQAWWVAVIWYLFTTTNETIYLILGLTWLVLDSYVRHIYNTFWIATGKSLKYYGGLAGIITKIDGRRSVYILHMIIWYIIGEFIYSIYTILSHCLLTAISYTYLALKLQNKKEN